METTEKIIECYVRYVRRWATIPNIKCDGQYEIDLLAIDAVTLQRYHIESSVSASKGFSRLTAKTFDPDDLKVRVQNSCRASYHRLFSRSKICRDRCHFAIARTRFHKRQLQKDHRDLGLDR